MIDVEVLHAAQRLAAVRLPNAAEVDVGNGAISDPLDGRSLVASVTGSVWPPPATGWPVVSPADALRRRGAVLQHADGHLAVSLGYGEVIEPYGREYAIAATGPDRFVAAWLPPTVVFTATL